MRAPLRAENIRYPVVMELLKGPVQQNEPAARDEHAPNLAEASNRVTQMMVDERHDRATEGGIAERKL